MTASPDPAEPQPDHPPGGRAADHSRQTRPDGGTGNRRGSYDARTGRPGKAAAGGAGKRAGDGEDRRRGGGSAGRNPRRNRDTDRRRQPGETTGRRGARHGEERRTADRHGGASRRPRERHGGGQRREPPQRDTGARSGRTQSGAAHRARPETSPAEQVPQGPPIPDEIAATDLHYEVRAELRSLSKPVADAVARRLVATGELLDVDPAEALAHALAARRPASRIAVVREAAGIAAYRAGEWKLAISELRAYQRISGRESHLAVVADCERALGRPERAVDLYRSAGPRLSDREEITELLIVAAGARRDLGQTEAAAAMLQVPALRSGPAETWVARLRYAYADTLIALGRHDEAREWFRRALDADPEGETGVAERLLGLEGVVLEEDEAGVDEAGPEPHRAATDD